MTTGPVGRGGRAVPPLLPTLALLAAACGGVERAVAPGDPFTGWTREVLGPGVELRIRHFEALYGAPQFVAVVAVQTEQSPHRIAFLAAPDIGEDTAPISLYGERSGAIAALNAGFGHGGPTLFNSGILRIGGRDYPYFDAEPDSLRFVGSAAVGIDSGGRLVFRDRPGDRWDEGWREVEDALAGGHRLLREGETTPRIREERWSSAVETRHAGGRHPRTAVCTTSDGTALLMVVDGRHRESEGLTLKELAGLLLELGCRDGINLDGGGSTTLWTRTHGVVNHPSGNGAFDHQGERPRKTAVVVR